MTASIMAACLITGCSHEATIYRTPKEVINVTVNHEFIIATASNPSTGYMWRETHDENILEDVASTFEVNEAVKRGETEVGLERISDSMHCRKVKQKYPLSYRDQT